MFRHSSSAVPENSPPPPARPYPVISDLMQKVFSVPYRIFFALHFRHRRNTPDISDHVNCPSFCSHKINEGPTRGEGWDGGRGDEVAMDAPTKGLGLEVVRVRQMEGRKSLNVVSRLQRLSASSLCPRNDDDSARS